MNVASMKGAASDAAPFRSLALDAAIEKLHGGTGRCVLDFGPGIGANIEFLLGVASRVQVADLFDVLSSLGCTNSDIGERICCPVFSALLPAQSERRFDLVLAWTLLDYLHPDDLPQLACHLKATGSPGMLVHALVSTRTKIPRIPDAFRIDPDGLRVLSRSNDDCDGPRHRQVHLLERFPGFRVGRSVLLRNGLQEYLLELT
jgi:hypothetical protein